MFLHLLPFSTVAHCRFCAIKRLDLVCAKTMVTINGNYSVIDILCQCSYYNSKHSRTTTAILTKYKQKSYLPMVFQNLHI